MKGTCTHCESDNLLEGLRIADQYDWHEGSSRDLQIELDAPRGKLFTQRPHTTISATMCCTCGHIMLFADPAFASNIKEFAEEMGHTGDPKKHPDYKEFLKSDPIHKHLNPNDQIAAFSQWLRKRR